MSPFVWTAKGTKFIKRLMGSRNGEPGIISEHLGDVEIPLLRGTPTGKEVKVGDLRREWIPQLGPRGVKGNEVRGSLTEPRRDELAKSAECQQQQDRWHVDCLEAGLLPGGAVRDQEFPKNDGVRALRRRCALAFVKTLAMFC